MLYKIYLCNILASIGFKCYLGSKSEINFLIKKIKNFIYIDKGYHKNVSESIYYNVRKNNGIIISLDEEGGVDFKDNSTLKGRYSKNLFEVCKKIFFWGPDQMNFFSSDKEHSSKFILSGHPRFELLKKKFHFLYEDDVNYIKKKYAEFILINTNMGFGNNIRGDKFILKNYGDRFKGLSHILNNDKIKLKKFISLIKKLSNLKLNIIIRPHPEEDFSTYSSAFKLNKNVSVINEKSVIPWIIASKTMIHPDCTTGIESLMLGKKSISYISDDLNFEYLTTLPLKASMVLNDEKEILKYLESNKFRSKVDFSKYDFLKNNFNFPGNSFEIISNELSSLIKNNENSNDLSCLDIFWRKTKNLIKLFESRKDRLISQKSKDFNYSNVYFVHNKIRSSNLSFKDNFMKRIFNKLYVFKKINKL